MGLFSKKLEFRTIDFVDHGKAFDYPKHLPIPRIGELVQIDGIFGRVVDVKHSLVEIRITCKE